MAVAPAVVPWQETVERGEEVLLRAGTQLHDQDARRGMGGEDDEQAVTFAGHESRAGLRQVGQPVAAGADFDLSGLQGKSPRTQDRTRRTPPREGELS